MEPKKIVWLQIAGLDYRQLPMIRYTRADSVKPSPIEQFDCLGGMWSYNLYQLRPVAVDSFFSQMTGEKNIKAGCAKTMYSPFWSYLAPNVRVGIFETPMQESNSFLSILKCSKKHKSYNNLWLWKMGVWKKSKVSKGSFHYLDRGSVKQPGVYYDRSCKKSGCYSSFYSNIISLYERFTKERENTVFIVRDFTYARALRQHNIPLAREILSDLEKVVDFFFDVMGSGSDTLFILSSAETQRIELPASGKSWKDFIEKGKGVLFHRTGLSSIVLAKGARAENFCGIFEESDLARRILFVPETPRGLEAFFKK